MRHNTVDLLGYAVIVISLQFYGVVEGLGGSNSNGASCKDVHGLYYETGSHFVPGPDPCTLCICDNGNPKWCKALYCRYKDQEALLNKDCKAFRFGNACCEYICVDESSDKDKGIAGTSFADVSERYDVKLVASCITATLSLGLLVFLVHRVRRRKIRVCVAGRQLHHSLPEEQRSLGSMGYIERTDAQSNLPMDELPCNGNGYPLWKPPSNYFPRGEAPPPYEEAVASSRAVDQAQLLTSSSQQALTSMNYPNVYLTPQHGHYYNNIVANSRNGLPASSPSLLTNGSGTGLTAPLNVISNRPLSSPAVHSHCYQLNQSEPDNSVNYCSGSCSGYNATSSNTYENLPIARSGLSNSASSISTHPVNLQATTNNGQVLMPNNPSTPINANSNYYRKTLPRQSPGAFTISSAMAAGSSSNSGNNHRTIPRTLTASGSLRLRRDLSIHQSVAPLFNNISLLHNNNNTNGNNASRSPSTSSHQAAPGPSDRPKTANSLTIIPSSSSLTSPISNDEASSKFRYYKSRSTGASPSSSSAAHNNNSTGEQQQQLKAADFAKQAMNFKPPLASANEVNEDGSFDSVTTCTCNPQASKAATQVATKQQQQALPPPLHDDNDDYRSECENCKSANSSGSRYYLDNESEMITSPHETMTLQRRPEDNPTTSNAPSKYYRTSLTLPTSTTRQRSNSGTRANWFKSMPESSTESSDGE